MTQVKQIDTTATNGSQKQDEEITDKLDGRSMHEVYYDNYRNLVGTPKQMMPIFTLNKYTLKANVKNAKLYLPDRFATFKNSLFKDRPLLVEEMAQSFTKLID